MYPCHLLASASSAATLKLRTVCLTCHLRIQAWQIREAISPQQALTVQICSLTAYASWHATWFPSQNQLFSDTRIWIGSSKDRLTSAFREMQILSVFSDRIFIHFSELTLSFFPLVCTLYAMRLTYCHAGQSELEICEYVCLSSCIWKTNQSKAMFDPTRFEQTHHALFCMIASPFGHYVQNW